MQAHAFSLILGCLCNPVKAHPIIWARCLSNQHHRRFSRPLTFAFGLHILLVSSLIADSNGRDF